MIIPGVPTNQAVYLNVYLGKGCVFDLKFGCWICFNYMYNVIHADISVIENLFGLSYFL